MRIEHENNSDRLFLFPNKKRITFYLDNVEFRYYPRTRELFRVTDSGGQIWITNKREKESILKRLLMRKEEARKLILSHSL